ncbi:MAG TPA: hypothetical protein VMD77_01895 [Candidatus Baltobacteraceae bacterium]|nr:hypothetical protein [Candidatus Baltobacteraceae bacterium]
MIQLLFFLLIGVALLSSLFFLVRRGSPRAEGDSRVLVDARKALDALQGGLLPEELVRRIFAKEDLDYVLSLKAPKTVRDLFIAERKKIALSWIAQVRTQISSLKSFHVGAARSHAKLGLRTEIQLACNFTTLLLACRALSMAIYVGGPYVAPSMVGATASAAAKICTISEQSLAFLNPVQLKPYASGSLTS